MNKKLSQKEKKAYDTIQQAPYGFTDEDKDFSPSSKKSERSEV